jgi:SAM-dependent methyltransferase
LISHTTISTRPHACVVCSEQSHTVEASGTDYQYATTDQSFDWCKCSQCGHFYINPVPTEAALGVIYPDTLKNYAAFDTKPGLGFRVKSWLDARQLRALTQDIPSGARLLDVGCAAGMLLDLARRHCPNFSELEGIEISEAAAARAKQKGYRVYISTIEQAPLPDAHYDLIYMQQVIEHVHDPRAVLSKVLRALKPGGRVVLETPNLYSLDHLMFRGGYWEGYHIPRHFNLWTSEGMTRMLREVGFSAVTDKKRIKPVHWTVSMQNWALATNKPRPLVRFFDLGNPLTLVTFGVLDVAQLLLLNKASDIQYVATK